MIGARQGTITTLRRFLARAMSRDLRGFVVPGADVARAAGLDLVGAGLHLSATPRHANVLIVIGPLPSGLADAASVAYGQMPRPRAILALGADYLASLPDADATGPLTQAGLVAAMANLRQVIAVGAFQLEVHDFEATVLQTRTEYTCPMHPEVVQGKPGDCPKCGMTLVPVAEAGEHTEHNHTGHDHGPHGQGHVGKDDHKIGEIIEGVEAHFMSMVDLTRDLPTSADGLKMEWIDVPFGPFFPGLPGGLQLDLTLDGDAVATTVADSAVGPRELLPEDATSPDAFVDHLAALSPLSPVAYRLLACRALEQAAGQSVTFDVARARIAAVEKERIASHLGWLAEFGAQSGFGWLEKRAAAFQLKLRDATPIEIKALTPKITACLRRAQRTPLLNARLKGIGCLTGEDALSGPVARATGIARDGRRDDPVYADLGFTVLTMADGDALARLALRCGEISQSLELISRAGAIAMPEPQAIGAASGTGVAVVESPRGAARLSLKLHKGKVTAADIETPTATAIALIATVADGRELGDALTGIGSLDISPWEVTA